MHIDVLYACVSGGSPKTGITDSCELPVGAENWAQAL